MVQNNEIKRINDVLAEGIRTRSNDATLEELIGLTDVANGALGDLLGGFTNTENLKAILGAFTATNNLKQLTDMLARPSIHLYEGWQDEAGIDATVWTVTDPATGAAWARGASGAYLRATSAPNANETARLRSNQRWIAAPDIYGTNTVLRKLVLEFEMKLTGVANLDETLTFIGLTPAVGNDRSSNNIIGWGINTDALESITDDAGVETTNTGFGETLTNWNKLKIEIYSGHVKFYINEVEVADHTTNLPDLPMYLNFFIDTAAGGAATIELGVIRAWTEDIAR